MNRAKCVAMIALCADLSMRQHCALIDWRAPGSIAPDPEELALMRWIDEQYLATQARVTADTDDRARNAGPRAEVQPAGSAASVLPPACCAGSRLINRTG